MKRFRIAIIFFVVLILLCSIGTTAYLLFSNYRNVRLFQQAQSNYQNGNLELAESQLLAFIQNDDDHENAFILLGEIAEKKRIYPEQLFYCYKAHRLNPLSEENKNRYIESMFFAREFQRLETFLAQQSNLDETHQGLLLYAAGINGNLNKYNYLIDKQAGKSLIGKLALLLYKDKQQTTTQQKLQLISEIKESDPFFDQEKLVAYTELYFELQDYDNAEKFLREAYELNEYAFASVLGRFYAKYRTLGQAVEVFEKYLAIYHDRVAAIQMAELYCLLGKTDKIKDLRQAYQSDSGSEAMFCSYYFDALLALCDSDAEKLQEFIPYLQDKISTPLATYMFLYSAFHAGKLDDLTKFYAAILEHKPYLDLQKHADMMVLETLKNYQSQDVSQMPKLLDLAEKLYKRSPDAFTAKFILLNGQKSNSTITVMLEDALNKFPDDKGLVKIAIEHYLSKDLAKSKRLITSYKAKFSKNSSDMLRYEIIVAIKENNLDRASRLFQENFDKNIHHEYWIFAQNTLRIADLEFLSKDKFYEPFCKALILLKNGSKDEACQILEKADEKGNLDLLFFAAKTLAENNRNHAALAKYAKFPPGNNRYKLITLLNTAEINAEIGNIQMALHQAEAAYKLAPNSPEVQICYADKLHKIGDLKKIVEVLNLSRTPYKEQATKLWIAGMESHIKTADITKEPEKVREFCRKLLSIDPDSSLALETMKKLEKIPK